MAFFYILKTINDQIINKMIFIIQKIIFFVLWWNTFIPRSDPSAPPKIDRMNKLCSLTLNLFFTAKYLSNPYIRKDSILMPTKYQIIISLYNYNNYTLLT